MDELTPDNEFVKSTFSDKLKNNKFYNCLNVTDAKFMRINKLIVQFISSNRINLDRLFTITCKVSNNITSCIYANLHVHLTENNKFITRFLSLSPSFTSQDGEYRGRVFLGSISDNIINKICSDRIICELYNKFEQYVANKLESGKFNFFSEVFHPNFEEEIVEIIEKWIDNERLVIRLFALILTFDAMDIFDNKLNNNFNPAYRSIIYNKDDKEFMKIVEENRKEFTEINKIMLKTNTITLYYNGQKTLTMTNMEILNIGDINYDTQREIYIMRILADLVLNFICPNVPVFYNNFYVHNAHAGLFDNKPIIDRFRMSEKAKEIEKYLVSFNRVSHIKDNKFSELTINNNNSIKFLESTSIIANVANVLMIEYVGNTLKDLPKVINILGLSGGIEFNKNIFELIYGLFCINHRGGVIHGDLHLNNMTMRVEQIEPKGNMINNKPLYDIYFLDDKEDIYCIPSSMVTLTMIDFSRSIIGNIDRLTKDFGKDYTEKFITNQNIRLINMLTHHFPKLIKSYKNDIERMLSLNFPLMFKVFTSIDAYISLSYILNLIKDNDYLNKIKGIQASYEKIENIIKQSELLLINNLQDAISGKITKVDDIKWPNWILLRDNFKEYSYTNFDPAVKQYYYIYNGMADMKVSGSSLDKWPLYFTNKLFPAIYTQLKNHDINSKQILKNIKEDKEKELKNIGIENWMLQ